MNGSWMKSLTGRRAHAQDDSSIHSFASPPLPPSAYTEPRTAPKPPAPAPRAYNAQQPPYRAPQRQPSLGSGSLRSAYSAHSAPAYAPAGSPGPPPPLPDTASSHHSGGAHPYGGMNAGGNVLGHRDDDDDERECPVCLEPLSFSFHLPGEKPHIVPECSHALHEVCTSGSVRASPSAHRHHTPRHASLPCTARSPAPAAPSRATETSASAASVVAR
jgi:hypothetical protein